MALDLNKVAGQVARMADSLRSGALARREKMNKALSTFSSPMFADDQIKKKIALSKTSWLVAGPVTTVNERHPAIAPPSSYAVLAADGSQIEADRHFSARCFLLNTGAVSLSYGAHASAKLYNTPRLYSSDDELVIRDPNGLSETPVEGNLLGIKRSVEECRELVELARQEPPEAPALALVDGTLIEWALLPYADRPYIVRELLDKGMLASFEELRKLSVSRDLALASYISYPGSSDVVNALRVILCPHEAADCDRYCTKFANGQRACDAVSGVIDRELFSSNLAPGERSGVFRSSSSVLEKGYGEHWIFFYYLNASGEIARIEVPKWVAENEELLDLSHSIILDQCKKGFGYPVVLSEAHEQAVVTGRDRDAFYRLVEETMLGSKLPVHVSAKSFCKKTRWV